MTLLQSVARATRFFLLGLAALALLGCAAGNLKPRAPVEDRGFGVSRPTPVVTVPSTTSAAPVIDAPKPQLNLENAGKPGYYTVRSGDTLIRVGLETGQNWRDLQRWNELENADRIEIGQVLRVVPPGQDPTQTAVRPIPVVRAESRPLESRPLPPGSITAATSTGTTSSISAGSAPMIIPPPAASSTPPMPATAPAPSAASSGNDEDMSWTWPAQGSVVSGFDESRNKGLAIGGKPGDTVVAAADGRVVYAGSGLRGYGNLVIIKHNETYLTAYAHNQALLVREDQSVRRGQKIAEMGSTDAERVQLHFEIRRRGKPVDPARLLPAR
jgi:lipoprotein NlpD